MYYLLCSFYPHCCSSEIKTNFENAYQYYYGAGILTLVRITCTHVNSHDFHYQDTLYMYCTYSMYNVHVRHSPIHYNTTETLAVRL